MTHKIISFLLMYFFITSTYAQTDAVLISTKPMIPYGIIGATNSVDTGVTIENGDIWIWGFRNSGQQGNGVTGVSPSTVAPARVNMFVQKGLNIVQSASGIYHMIALDDKGDVWGWGQNGYDEAGAKICTQGYVNYPCQILQGKNVVQIVAGEYVSYALTESGDVYAWGHGIYGQIGNGGRKSSNGLYKIPQSYFNNQKVIMIGAAYEGAYAINEVGEIFGWGDEQEDSFGYTNASTHVYVDVPKKLNISINGRNIDYICGGEAYTAYLTNTGTVYGIGQLVRLGQGIKYNNTSAKSAYPVKIIDNIRTLYCRYAGAVGITHDNKLYTWGSNLSNDPFNIYGEVPINRSYYDTLTKIDGGKENIYYWTDKGKGYGVGYGSGHKLDQSSNATVDWKGKELTFLANEMKKIYGKDYVLGQGL